MKNNLVGFRPLLKIVFLMDFLVKNPHFLGGFQKGNSKILTPLERYKKVGFFTQKNIFCHKRHNIMGVGFKDG
jgi:hypothetical protein